MAAAASAKGHELGTLVVVVLKARNLPDKHTFTKQDPYANVQLGTSKEQTNIDKRGGQHPVWDQEFRIQIPKNASKENRTMKLSCYSKEPKEDYLIGEGEVDISKTLETGEFDDWVLLTSNDAYRGEIYLEMTFFGRGPAALARRVSKLPSSERLWRPPQTPPKTPPHANGHLRPPGASSPPRHAQKLSPPKKDEALPSVPVSGGIPDSLRPAAGPRPGGKPQAGLTSVPTILRPGGPSRPASAAKVHRQSGPSYDVSAPAAGPAPQHHVPSGPSYGTAQNAIPQHRTPPPQSYGYTNYNVPAGPDTPPIQSYNHNAAAGHVAPYGPAPAPAPAYTGVDYQRRPSADGVGGDDYIPLSFPEPALPVAANSRAPPAHDRQQLLSQRYGSPLPLPANAQVSRPSPQARPPQAQAQAHTQAQTRTQAQSQVPRSHTSSVEVPESYLERERAALERARMEEADADFARRLAAEEETAEGTSVGRTAPPPLPPRSQSKSQEEEDEELARQLARELNSDVLNESRQGENGMPGGW